MSFRIGHRSTDHTAVSTQAGLRSTNARKHKDIATVHVFIPIDLSGLLSIKGDESTDGPILRVEYTSADVHSCRSTF